MRTHLEPDTIDIDEVVARLEALAEELERRYGTQNESHNLLLKEGLLELLITLNHRRTAY